jgi:hypothetical protein
MKPIIDTRINSAPATALGRTLLRTLLRIVFNAVRKGSNFSDVIVFSSGKPADWNALRIEVITLGHKFRAEVRKFQRDLVSKAATSLPYPS